MTWFGNFDENGRPSVAVAVNIASAVGWVKFLVDTGADTSMLGWSDMRNFGIDPNTLPGPVTSMNGVSGSMQVRTVEADISIVNPTSRRIKTVRVGLDLPIDPQPVDHDGRLIDIPSLLGRDFLGQFRFTHDPRSDLVMFEE